MAEQSPRWGMIPDVERYTGCHACSVACKVENEVPLGSFRTKVYYYDRGRFPRVERHFLPVVCMQCADAPCLKACPTRSVVRLENGIVHINQETCRGFGQCEDACPYGAVYVDPQRNIADKCNFCEHRLEVGMEPACVETCPGEVFIFGDLNDPSELQTYELFARPLSPEEVKDAIPSSPGADPPLRDAYYRKNAATGRTGPPATPALATTRPSIRKTRTSPGTSGGTRGKAAPEPVST